jgi:hypothetical protein
MLSNRQKSHRITIVKFLPVELADAAAPPPLVEVDEEDEAGAAGAWY